MNVILFTTGCPKCAVIKKKLDLAQIDYTENDSVEEMTRLGLKSAPALMVDSRLMNFGEANRWIGEYVSERTPAG